MTELIVHRIGGACTVQDSGRAGYLDHGLSRSGAADFLALREGAALLGNDSALAAMELPGFGGEFEATEDTRIALSGAPMQVAIDGEALAWNAVHFLGRGQRLTVGAARSGVYGYLHVAGGFDTPSILGSRSSHLTAGLGHAVQVGDHLPIGPARSGPTGLTLDVSDRFSGGTVRIVDSVQTALFPEDVRQRFEDTAFRRGPRANRMGVQLASDGPGFSAEGQLNILSEVIVPGDIQMTGDGNPFVLLPECQTTGGYPRIGTVIPCDMPVVAQAPAGARLQFKFVTLDAALAAQRGFAASVAALAAARRPLIRRAEDIADLLSYQLIGGMISAHGDEGERT